jgi:hypothetical protein
VIESSKSIHPSRAMTKPIPKSLQARIRALVATGKTLQEATRLVLGQMAKKAIKTGSGGCGAGCGRQECGG